MVINGAHLRSGHQGLTQQPEVSRNQIFDIGNFNKGKFHPSSSEVIQAGSHAGFFIPPPTWSARSSAIVRATLASSIGEKDAALSFFVPAIAGIAGASYGLLKSASHNIATRYARIAALGAVSAVALYNVVRNSETIRNAWDTGSTNVGWGQAGLSAASHILNGYMFFKGADFLMRFGSQMATRLASPFAFATVGGPSINAATAVFAKNTPGLARMTGATGDNFFQYIAFGASRSSNGYFLAYPRIRTVVKTFETGFDFAERASLWLFLGDLGVNFAMNGGEHLSSSVAGGMSMILFLNKIAARFGVRGTRLMFAFDRVPDVLMQKTSGRAWSDLDGWRMSMNYLTGTLLGHVRGQFWMGTLGRYLGSARMFHSVTLRGAEGVVGRHVIGDLTAAERAVVDKLYRYSQWDQSVQLVTKAGGVGGGSKYAIQAARMIRPTPNGPFVDSPVIHFTHDEKGILKRLLQTETGTFAGPSWMQRTFHRLGVTGNGNGVTRAAYAPDKRLNTLLTESQVIELTSNNSWGGMLPFFLIHEATTGYLVELSRFQTVMQGDRENAFWYHTYRQPILAARAVAKSALGWVTPEAIIVNSVIRNVFEPPVTKFAPLFAGKKFWKNRYGERIAGGPAALIRAHTADGPLHGILEGGFARWNRYEAVSWVYPNVLDRQSPITPMKKDYRDLAEWYATGRSPEEQNIFDRVDRSLSAVIREVEFRDLNNDQTQDFKLAEFETPLLRQQALAISAAVQYARQVHPGRFSHCFREHPEWFANPGYDLLKDPRDVENFVAGLSN